VPVELDLGDVGRLPEAVEIAAYYVVAEALTNAAKHAGAELARVHVEVAAGRLALTIADDGAGGADPSRGSGLIGLRDRVEALGGLLALRSERGAGTVLRVEIPVVTPAPRQRPQILR
jgi:signal transduction histidine kinase